MNYYLLQYLILQLQNKISGSILQRIISPQKNIFYIIFIDKNGSHCLEFCTVPKSIYMFSRENFSVPNKNVPDLLEVLNSSRMSSFELINEDKLACITLDENKKLIISLVNAKENIIYTENDVIKDAVKGSKEIVGKKLFEYIPALVSDKAIQNSVSARDHIRANFPKAGNEVFISIEKAINAAPAHELNEELRIKIDSLVNEFKRNLNTPEYSLYSKDGVLYPSIFQLHEPTFTKLKTFGDANLLLESFSHETYRLRIFKEVKEKKEKELSKKIGVIEKSIKNINERISDVETSVKYKLDADAILANLNSISPAAAEFIYNDYNGVEQKIKLKTELSASENAQFYYQKYKRQKASIEILRSKLEKLLKDKHTIEAELLDVENITEIKKLKKMEKNFKKDEADETSRFRKFVLNEKAEVWVGKDSASNDLLTTRYSAQNDLWFHVRGFSGSHTVLKLTDKSSDPPSDQIKTAAAIAAYYSKARNGGNVPVAYTERKYVKKKKGFKEGSVIMEREKVVFVKPKLPDQ